MVYGGFSIDRMNLSGTFLTIVTSFAREEINQLTSKMFMKSLHKEEGNLGKSKPHKYCCSMIS